VHLFSVVGTPTHR